MARIFNIMRFSVHDGPGIRTTVFFQGCPLRCAWCHNPESRSFRPVQMTFEERCRRCGACVEVCPRQAIPDPRHNGNGCAIPEVCDGCGTCAEACVAGARQIAGREVTIAELVREIERDRVFFDDSKGGVTLSGGEPLAQPVAAEDLLRACREREIHTTLDTCGYAAPDVFDRVTALADLVLFDVKILDPARHEQYTGVSNHLIHENLRRLASRGQEVTVRFPLIPGVNDTPAELHALSRLIDECRLRRVDVLPYHTIGRAKLRRLGQSLEEATDFRVPSEDEAQVVAATLRHDGIQVLVGGSL